MDMAHRVTVRQHYAVFDVNIHVTISDLHAVHELTDIYMRDASILVCIRIVSYSVCVTLCKTTSQLVLDEMLSDLHWIRISDERKEPIGVYLIRNGAKDSVGVNGA